MSEEVLIESSNGVMVITINRPQARNAINRTTALAIAAAMDTLDESSDIHVAVLTGADGTFSAGMDLKGYARGEKPLVEGRGFAGFVENPPAKPLIAAVEGHAVGGGFEIALACDLIIAGASANFGLPEVKRGLVAGAGGLMALPRQIPERIALELALTGDSVSARRVFELGLINLVTEAGGALEAAKQMAQKIADNGPLAVLASKKVVKESRAWTKDELFRRQSDILNPVYASEDAKEGIKAAAEKRRPVWKGR